MGKQTTNATEGDKAVENATPTESTTVAKETAPAAVTKQESTTKESKEAVYKVSELAAAAKEAFNTRPEVVTAALLSAKKTSATKSEAKRLVEAFLKKEVK